MSTSTVVVQSSLLLLIRVGLYQFCQRVFLRPLVQDLRHLSSTSPSPSSSIASGTVNPNSNDVPESSDGEYATDASLPPPASASATSASARFPRSPANFLSSRSSSGARRGALTGADGGTSASTGRGLSGGGALGGRGHFHAKASRAAFALCFSESIVLFVLVVCQSVDVLSERTLFLNWKLSLSTVLALVMLLIPLLQSLFMTYRWSSGVLQKRNLIALVPYSAYLYLVTLIPGSPQASTSSPLDASSLQSQSQQTTLAFPLPQALGRLTLMGVLILGTLSGFGAVRNATVLISSVQPVTRTGGGSKGTRKSGIISEEDVTHAEGSLRRIRGDLEDRRAQMTRLKSTALSAEPKGSWMSRVFSGNSETTALQQEIDGLEALERSMSSNLTTLRARREADVFSQTFSGRMLNGATAVFGVYCVYRMLVSTLNLVVPWSRSTPSAAGGSPSDVIIRFLLSTFPSLETSLDITPERAVSLSRQFSLLMVGVIVLSSVRLVLRGVNKILSLTSKNLGASFMLLILAQLMGTYLLSTLIQLRASFPPPPAYTSPAEASNVSLFTTLPQFEVFGPLFDLSFILSALVSFLGGRALGMMEAVGEAADG